jgi:hypothetical protein
MGIYLVVAVFSAAGLLAGTGYLVKKREVERRRRTLENIRAALEA